MENGWSLFNTSITATTNTSTTNNSTTTTSSSSRGHNGHCNNLAWDIWDMGTSRFDWNTTSSTSFLHHHHQQQHQQQPPSSATVTAASEAHALMLGHQTAASLYSGAAGPHYYHPDPHLMCLKLGKRHYFEDATGAPLGDCHVVGGGGGGGKRGKTYYGGGGGGEVVGTSAPAPRCQVDGCNVALVNAKEYHRRHKVCEMHSKAPKVEVLGLEQRFCQQCSRFHEVSEFDDSKRSCRRRLAGHNERRRKGSHDSIPRSPHPSLSHENKLMAERFSYLTLPTGRALSLLSSSWKNNSWFSSSDLSLRCSAALRELIAENRAAILARQLVLERDWHRGSHDTMDDVNATQLAGTNPMTPHHHQMFPEPHGYWDRFKEGSGHVTLDLMQAPSSAFGLLSVRGKSKEEEEEEEEEEECSGLWTHMV
ncbi:hypothetical protein CsSME_00012410 [Camellia sinensis var. sinensis]